MGADNDSLLGRRGSIFRRVMRVMLCVMPRGPMGNRCGRVPRCGGRRCRGAVAECGGGEGLSVAALLTALHGRSDDEPSEFRAPPAEVLADGVAERLQRLDAVAHTLAPSATSEDLQAWVRHACPRQIRDSLGMPPIIDFAMRVRHFEDVPDTQASPPTTVYSLDVVRGGQRHAVVRVRGRVAIEPPGGPPAFDGLQHLGFVPRDLVVVLIDELRTGIRLGPTILVVDLFILLDGIILIGLRCIRRVRDVGEGRLCAIRNVLDPLVIRIPSPELELPDGRLSPIPVSPCDSKVVEENTCAGGVT
mmetsp:Transcript_5612/g.11121  ORF Transcript_5612/g.11121 Transcript_5612/m.11121 type:complete len:304 (+) Transcript_5612:261-1172(+)